MDISDFSITVVGLGLIGGSFAASLKKLKPKNVWGIDVKNETLDNAQKMGIIDKGYTDPEVPLNSSDIVIIALYPEDTVRFVKDNINYFKKGSIITDTTGVKRNVIKKIESLLPDYIDFIGGHPMAGRESQGLKMASEDMFVNSTYILTPSKKSKKKNIDIVSRMAKCIGCKNVVQMTPEEHDSIIAYVSHIPHVIAVSLLNSNMDDIDISLFAAGSFKDATRVASINCDLWTELFMSNRDNVIRFIDELGKNLSVIKDGLEKENKNIIREQLKSANGIKERNFSNV